jgi:probable rRNA maturation factor
MEPLVDTVIEDPRWEVLGLDPLATRAAEATFAHLDLPQAGFMLCLMGGDDLRIAGLNHDFRGKAQPTNVLSWPDEDLSPEADGGPPLAPEPGTADDPRSLGDIALAYETCAREAAEGGKPLADHVTHLVVHGLLHLLGYDHVRDGDAARMEAAEVAILASLGLSDPYL